MDIHKKFGTTIKLLRNEKGISQERFALLIGMDRTYYASIESGKGNLSLTNIKKLLMVLILHYQNYFL